MYIYGVPFWSVRDKHVNVVSFPLYVCQTKFINLTRSDMYVKVRMVVSGVSSTGICNIAKTSQTLSNIRCIKVNEWFVDWNVKK